LEKKEGEWVEREGAAADIETLAKAGAEVEVAWEQARRPEQARERQHMEVEEVSGLSVRSDTRVVPSLPFYMMLQIARMEMSS
jgi:hypothetical protein